MQPSALLVRGDPARDRCVEGEAERDDECGAAEVSHAASSAEPRSAIMQAVSVLARLRYIPLPTLAAAAVVLMATSLALIFFYAPLDADQGLSAEDLLHPRADRADRLRVLRRGAWKAFLHLWKRPSGAGSRELCGDPPGRHLRSPDARHRLDLGQDLVGALVDVESNQLVTFLILFLFYSAYFMLRYSVEPGPARANMCAVYALFGVVLIPVSWLSIRIANDYIHPTVFTRDGPQMSGSMFLAFCVSWAALLALAGTMYRVELAGKRLDERLRELRELLA